MLKYHIVKGRSLLIVVLALYRVAQKVSHYHIIKNCIKFYLPIRLDIFVKLK